MLILGGGIVGLTLASALCTHCQLTTTTTKNQQQEQQERSTPTSPQLRIYEAANEFVPDVGAGMGMYPNGCRVLHDIDTALLQNVRAQGHDYQVRTWTSHDGTEIVTAQETVLSRPATSKHHHQPQSNRHDTDETDETEKAVNLESFGIRRWKLQEGLYRHVVEHCHVVDLVFGKRVARVDTTSSSRGHVRVQFTDHTYSPYTKVLFACDGGKSIIRTQMLASLTTTTTTKPTTTKGEEGGGWINGTSSSPTTSRTIEKEDASKIPELKYTGVTCLMGIADFTRATTDDDDNQVVEMELERGISFPSSLVTKCHATFFPTSPREICFQFHFPIDRHTIDYDDDTSKLGWGQLADAVQQEECHKLATALTKDGWHDKYTRPLQYVTKAIQIGFATLTPPLQHWTFSNLPQQQKEEKEEKEASESSKDAYFVALVGDAAHPPVPYTGQGAQQGLEDAGTLALLLKEFCMENGTFDIQGPDSNERLQTVMTLYEQIRIPRVQQILQNSQDFGKMQQLRADSPKYNVIQSEKMQRQVFFHETLPVLLPGAQHDYRQDVEQTIAKYRKEQQQRAVEAAAHLPSLPEGTSGEETESSSKA